MSRFVRFVCYEPVDGLSHSAGFLDAAYRLRVAEGTDDHTVNALTEAIDWFKKHLPIPHSFSRSSSKKQHVFTKGLSWFKSSASDHIAKAHEVLFLLNENAIQTETLRTDRVGYVVYEDEWQVVAEPFADTPTGRPVQ